MDAAGENRFGHLFLTFDLRLHLNSTRSPCTFQLIIQMARGALAGESNILAKQIVGVRCSFSNQLDVIIKIAQHIAGCELDIVDQIVEQSGVDLAISNHTLLVVIRLRPKVTARIPGSQLHDELFVRLIHHRRLIRRSQVGLNIEIAQELLL
ncbi:hypothetical protein D3C78_804640 [compost metagenome]